jgi:hypothetical protein
MIPRRHDGSRRAVLLFLLLLCVLHPTGKIGKSPGIVKDNG